MLITPVTAILVTLIVVAFKVVEFRELTLPKLAFIKVHLRLVDTFILLQEMMVAERVFETFITLEFIELQEIVVADKVLETFITFAFKILVQSISGLKIPISDCK